MNKYAAGGKCGSMSSSSSAFASSSAGTLNIAALMAQREKDDMFFSSSAKDAKAPAPAPAKNPSSLQPLQNSQHSQELVIKKKYNQSDIDIILGGD